MRTEKEMLDLIMRIAKEDPRIRAAYLEGSRVDPRAPEDIFQDYDVVYVVEETKSFQEDRNWIDLFGERLFMQYPEDSVYYPSDKEQCYGWLIMFADGNRLDLHVCTAACVQDQIGTYSILLDKDDIFQNLPAPAEDLYLIQKPTQPQFLCTCNEFWWCLNNVAKGLWRDELPYAIDMIDFVVRPMLKRLLEWRIGLDTDFKVSAGKMGKYFKRYLAEHEYQQFLNTYSAAEKDQVWNAVFEMCDLFDAAAKRVSADLGFEYDLSEAHNSRKYLEDVRVLPADAVKLY